MRRFFILLGVLLFAPTAFAQNVGRVSAPLDDTNLLRYEGVRKELRLSPQQDAKIMGIFREMRLVNDSSVRMRNPNLKTEDPKAYEAYWRREAERERRWKALRSGVIGILTRSQKARLRQLHIQTLAGGWHHPEIAKELGLSTSQRKRLEALELQNLNEERMYPIKRNDPDSQLKFRKRFLQARANAANILTASQRKKLLAMQGKLVDTRKLLTNRYAATSRR